MRGTVIGFKDGVGWISGTDNNRYKFEKNEWQGTREPFLNNPVDFIALDNQATQIIPLVSRDDRSIAVLAIICWFFGLLGVHRFIVGKTGSGIVMLLLTLTLFGIVITWFWSFFDFIFILAGAFTDKNGEPIKGLVG